MEIELLLLLCYIVLQQLGSALPGDTEYIPAGHSDSRKRRNLIYLEGAEILVKSKNRQ
jgi:hypothetical protein